MKKRMIAFIAVMLCLTFIGVAYAAWTQNILINGSVATGNLDIVWIDVSLDRSTEPTYQGNYVATISQSLSGDGHTITYQVSNAFPGWSSKLNCKIENSGTIPANLSVSLSRSSNDIQVTGYDAIPTSLTNGGISGNIVLTISIPSTVTIQNQSYTFTLTVTGTQFNM